MVLKVAFPLSYSFAEFKNSFWLTKHNKIFAWGNYTGNHSLSAKSAIKSTKGNNLLFSYYLIQLSILSSSYINNSSSTRDAGNLLPISKKSLKSFTEGNSKFEYIYSPEEGNIYFSKVFFCL